MSERISISSVFYRTVLKSIFYRFMYISKIDIYRGFDGRFFYRFMYAVKIRYLQRILKPISLPFYVCRKRLFNSVFLWDCRETLTDYNNIL
jgi:hypothetical protein